MKKLTGLIFIALLSITYNSFSSDVQMGFGLSYGGNNRNVESLSMASVPQNMMNFHFNIDFDKGIRLEPFFGYFSETSDVTDYEREQYFNSTDGFRLGIGAFLRDSLGYGCYYYFGGRLSMVKISSEFMITLSDEHGNTIGFGEIEGTRSVVSVGPAFGAEYYLSKHFVIGIEGQLNFINFGKMEETPSTWEDIKYEHDIISTHGLVFIRVIF